MDAAGLVMKFPIKKSFLEKLFLVKLKQKELKKSFIEKQRGQ